MADILDMISYRQLQRQRRQFKKELDECSRHPSLEHHPTWEPTDEDKERSRWAYGPEGLSDARSPESNLEASGGYAPHEEAMLVDTEGYDGPETAFSIGDDGKLIEVPVPGKPLATVIPLAPARIKRAATLTGKYLDEILEKAYDGNIWAQFRLALIQITDEPIDDQVYIMQQTFPEMEVHQFEAYLERAIEEFDEYSNLMEENDQQ